VAAVVAVVSALVWATHYAPLQQGLSSRTPVEGGTLVQPIPESGGQPVFFVRPGTGEVFRVGLSVSNGGSQAVSLLGSPISRKAGSQVFRVLRAELGPPNHYGGTADYPRQFTTFDAAHPVSLPAGDERELFLTYSWVGRCLGGAVPRPWRQGSTGATVGLDVYPLRFRLWGLFTRTQWLKLPYVLTAECKTGIDTSTDVTKLPAD
jgi:hypothetical protein